LLTQFIDMPFNDLNLLRFCCNEDSAIVPHTSAVKGDFSSTLLPSDMMIPYSWSSEF
jgi:hypothetical protein